MSARVYLDWNATAPLRPEARAAMAAAMDVVGNPSSVHAEGRAARAIVERARAQVAEATGCLAGDVVFTSGATEAAALALAGRGLRRRGGRARLRRGLGRGGAAGRCATGGSRWPTRRRACCRRRTPRPGWCRSCRAGLACVDAAQAVGRMPFAFDWSGARAAIVAGAQARRAEGRRRAAAGARGRARRRVLRGGGQELGRRAGTENVVGIAGFGAAAEAAAADLAAGVWEEVAEVRNILEEALASAAPSLSLSGRRRRGCPTPAASRCRAGRARPR